MMIKRIATGISGFDELIENGFPKGSLILVSGRSGAGKTTFAAEFYYNGATSFGESGVYVCFAETKKAFHQNMLQFGWDLRRLETVGKCITLDLSSVEQNVMQHKLNIILEHLTALKARRLVIDSFSAMTMASVETIDVQYLVRLLYAFLQKIGCTTILISDTPFGSRKIGSGVEEFIADGIILLQIRFNKDGELRRELRIQKMRSTNHSKRTHRYEITEKGIVVLRATEGIA